MAKNKQVEKQFSQEQAQAYWRANIRIILSLLAIWFVVSYLLGIILAEPLYTTKIGQLPVSFWFAQQGSIYVFVVLILAYALLMDRLDKKYGLDR